MKSKPLTPAQERKKLIDHLISEIDSYMKPKDFQRPLFESISEQYHDQGTITDKQLIALTNVYKRVTGG